MWIFLNDAFVSVVAVPGKPGKLLVRARRPGDVQRALGDPKLIEVETPKADYRYRAEVDWAVVQEALTQRLEALDYPNFKNSVKDHARHEAYSSVWWSMYDYQHGRFDRPKTTTGKRNGDVTDNWVPPGGGRKPSPSSATGKRGRGHGKTRQK